MALTTALRLTLTATLTKAYDLVTPSSPLSYIFNDDLGTGVGADQGDRIWNDERTLALSATEDLDLSGALLDPLGDAVVFARIKALIVAADAANTNTVDVGAGTAGLVGWIGNVNDVVKVRPGGLLLLWAPDATGYPVTPTTADILKITNGGAGTPVTYRIILIGTSA
jgi:hypothetical protein